LKFFFTERTEVLAPVRPVVLRGGDVDIRSAQQLAGENKVAVLCLGLVWLLPRSAPEEQH
jgi:hypothetical protein